MATQKKSERKPSSHTQELETIRQVLVDAGFTPQAFRQDDAEGFVMDLKDDLYESAIAMVVSGESRFLFTIDLQDKGRHAVLPRIAEFLARVNFGLLAGTFEMDYEDGSARYRASLDYEGTELSGVLVRNIVLGATETCQCYVPALAAVIRGELTAKEAFDEVEPLEEPEMEPSLESQPE
jgi:hypothetical protein